MDRFIPARAGNARGPTPRLRRGSVHPRAGGERIPQQQPDARQRRFIPARAGNARSQNRPADEIPVHPRAGGERAAADTSPPAIFGSSPRGRGTPADHRPANGLNRFIPARAGNAVRRRWSGGACSVHPRAGGERLGDDPNFATTIGSSPRGRGTPADRRRGFGEDRFIPARAGNAVNCRMLLTDEAVHPRAGGERTATASRKEPLSGSSPRGRGTRSVQGREHSLIRFIPARAGNARFQLAVPWIPSVHPRAGGERSPRRHTPAMRSGSSPRGRGTRRGRPGRVHPERFIPARAGNASL